MRTSLWIGIAFAGAVFAQQGGQQKQKQPPAPPLIACDASPAGVEILCGTKSPEDLELTPDKKYLIVSQFVNPRNGATGAGLVLFDLAKKTYAKMPVTNEPKKDWGDPSCPGPAGDAGQPHGISLGKHAGANALYVVTHGPRESIEMYELAGKSGNWSLIWRGCVVAIQAFNDVAIMPDGGYVGTHPNSLVPPGGPGGAPAGPGGAPAISGEVGRWIPGKGEMTLPGTRAAFPNGVLVSANGGIMYFNAWTGKEVHKYDLQTNMEIAVIKLDFQPDNITWTAKRQMLAAGVRASRGECPEGSGIPCGQTFGIAQIDPAKFTSKTMFDSQGKGALISGVSVALEVGNAMYVGAFQGDRLVKIMEPK